MTTSSTDAGQVHAAHHTVQVTVNNQPVDLPDRNVTGREIKQDAIDQGVQIQPSFTLSVKHGDRYVPVGDDEPQSGRARARSSWRSRRTTTHDAGDRRGRRGLLTPSGPTSSAMAVEVSPDGAGAFLIVSERRGRPELYPRRPRGWASTSTRPTPPPTSTRITPVSWPALTDAASARRSPGRHGGASRRCSCPAGPTGGTQPSITRPTRRNGSSSGSPTGKSARPGMEA